MRHAVGSKVMCIRTLPSGYTTGGHFIIQPELHTVYTVRGYHPDHPAALWLEEIRNEHYGTLREMTFFYARFVPVLRRGYEAIEKMKREARDANHVPMPWPAREKERA